MSRQTGIWSLLGLGMLMALPVLAQESSEGARARPIRVCADPGNMPFSNERGEGLENKLAELLAHALGTSLQYYYRPTIERGMTRTTLDADECDLMFDMPMDAERVLLTTPLYRTTFVLAYRQERAYNFKNLDDPRLKKLRIGVYQTSAIREALANHDVRGNVQIHYLSHDADLVSTDQPIHQVEQVLDGTLDVAAVWGPFAGYYRAVKQAPLTLQPVNRMEDGVPQEFDMSLAVRTIDRNLHERLEQALVAQRGAIRDVLVQFGVPLVECADCIVSGDIPSHGPYRSETPVDAGGTAAPSVSIATLNQWLAHGANVNQELNNAVIADDRARVSYLLERKHADINAQDLQGQTPLLNALGKHATPMARYLVEHGANVETPGRDGWTPLMTAAWADDGAAVKLLADHHVQLDRAGPGNLTPLAIALRYLKESAAAALISAGADITHPIGEGGYSALMVAVAGHSVPMTRLLLDRHAEVNATNAGGVTALMIAAAGNQPELVSLLLKAGADSARKSETGDTALSLAQSKGYTGVVQLLGGGAPGGA